MTLDKIQTVVLILTFMVPGFIIHSIFSLFTIRRKEEKEILFLRYIAFSTLNLVICLWLIRLLVINNYLINRPFLAVLFFFIINFVSPIFLGVVIGYLDKIQFVRYLFQCKPLAWMNIVPLHPTPSPWEYKFNLLCEEIKVGTDGRFVRVKLSDGSEVLGHFGGYSFSSTDTTERDLYLDFVYDKEETGQWVCHERSNGILIRGGNIQTIEFLLHEEPCQSTSEVPLPSSEVTEEEENAGRKEQSGQVGRADQGGDQKGTNTFPDNVSRSRWTEDWANTGGSSNAATEPASGQTVASTK